MNTEYDEVRKNFDITIWKKLLVFVRPYLKTLFYVFAMMAFLAIVDIMIPLFLRYSVDHFIADTSTEGIWIYIVVYLSVLLLQTLGMVEMARGSMNIEMKLGRDLKKITFSHLKVLGFSYYNQNAVGWILSRVMSDTNRISGVIAWALTDIFWSIAYVIGIMVVMVSLNAELGLLIMILIPIVAIITSLFQGKLLDANRLERSANSRITAAFNEGITGAKTSKTLVIEGLNQSEFEKVTQVHYSAVMRSAKLNAVFVPIITFFSSLAVMTVLVRGGVLNLSGSLEIGTLSAFISYALGLLEPVSMIARGLADFISTQASIERVFGLLETEPDIIDTPEVIAKYGDSFEPKRENWEKIEGAIEFKDLNFKYPDGDEYILENFNLTIPKGSVVAIVGETGAGKSTLVNLACRFFEPTSGQVLIDGVDVKERSVVWLHSQLGYVLQDPHLFSGSIKDNIRYAKLDATDEEITSAAKLVSADKVTDRLEKGFETEVGEGGEKLSTGEKQLISFARAVLADPPIFVLDEATSSIDTETEALIQDAIARILGGRTSLIVAHRLSTIRHADLIIVIDNGKIKEMGKHRELIAKKGVYYHLYTSMKIEDLMK
jgi:ATP-binding cassette subfamily B protein